MTEEEGNTNDEDRNLERFAVFGRKQYDYSADSMHDSNRGVYSIDVSGYDHQSSLELFSKKDAGKI